MKSVAARIHEYNKDRDPFFLKLKYQAMRENPFRFFRGSCHLFYEDLSEKKPFEDPTKAWICGDLHIENYGSYKAGNGQVYFDIVDFDEAVLAPVTWEIARTLTSIYLATDLLGLSVAEGEDLVKKFFKTYRQVILSGKPVTFERNTAPGLMKKFIRTVEKRKLKDLVSERTVLRKNKITLKIIQNRTVKLSGEKKLDIIHSLSTWAKKYGHKKWKICDAVHRIAGTGSLGLDRYLILAEDTALKKYFLLDMKESTASCLKPYIEISQPEWTNNADRIVKIQNLMQGVSFPMLETMIHHEKPYVLKKLQPQADMMSLKLCHGKPGRLHEVIETFAEISASAGLRSTGRLGSSTADELIAFCNSDAAWKTKLLNFSKNYASQVKKDFHSFCQSETTQV